MGNTILKMSKISKSFNGIKVLDKVDFEVLEGEVHALMGGNGAGKSTLMKILTGVYQLDSGDIEVDGKKVSFLKPNDATEAGISMIFQEFSLIPKLSIAENIFLNREPRSKFGLIDDKKMLQDSHSILEQLDLDIPPKELVENISVGYWQMTEIAKAISKNAKILIMDEPTATLTKKETESLFELITKLKRSGVTIIYISHRMDEIFQVCDRITVLRNGKNIATKKSNETNMDELINNIIGGNMRHSFEWIKRQSSDSRKVKLEVKNLKSGPKVKNVSFSLYEGEILGIAGLMGSGRSETARAIFGIDSIENGEIYINGDKKVIKAPNDAISFGIGLVPEDRRTQGLVLEHTVKENTILPSLRKISNNSFVQDKPANDIVRKLVEKLNVKTDSIFTTISSLSGGNQQKVVLAKWLINNTNILILDEATNGVDIGAKTEIIEIVREFADSGGAVLVISSEITELLAMSDRILIMKEGIISNSIHREDINNEEDVERAIQNIN